MQKKTITNIKSASLFILLLIGAFLVLLPMIWMVITAVKQPGQGLKFNFFPKTIVMTDKFIPDSKPTLIIEIKKDASNISIAGTFNDWDKNKNKLNKIKNNIWQTSIKLEKPGTYEYKFVINGKDWIKDPAIKSSGDNTIINIKPGLNFNKNLSAKKNLNLTVLNNNVINFKFFNNNTPFVNVITDNNKKITLLKNAQEYWEGTIPLENIKSYKFEYKRSFKEAFNEIYTLNNFKKVLFNKDFPFAKFFLNSLVVATLSGLFTVILCTMAGYAFAKKNFYGRDKIFLLLMGSMMIPGMIFMVPQYALIAKFGLINSYFGMVLPHLANVFGVFLLRQYIKTIPNSLFEAAKIDGASELQCFKIIVLPLAMPIIITLFLLTFLGQWSNFLWQLIVNTPDSPFRTLPVGLALFKGQYAMDWELIMAGSCFSIIPIAILFLVAQRFFMEGMTGGAVKE